MTSAISEQLRKLADEAENPKLDDAVRQLQELVVPFPDLVNPVCGECGWGEDEHKTGKSMADHAFHAGPEEGTPFFSEGYLYDLLGKEDARSVLAVIRQVLRAAGVAERDLHL